MSVSILNEEVLKGTWTIMKRNEVSYTFKGKENIKVTKTKSTVSWIIMNVFITIPGLIGCAFFIIYQLGKFSNENKEAVNEDT